MIAFHGANAAPALGVNATRADSPRRQMGQALRGVPCSHFPVNKKRSSSPILPRPWPSRRGQFVGWIVSGAIVV